ncbi:MAG: hypothetical protein PVI23_16090 [Maricaulaceae bacterium]|jgi:hypothetical protein
MTATAESVCDECGSGFIRAASPMTGLCAECAHQLYGHSPCAHAFENGRCSKCGWDGSTSDYLKERGGAAED